MPEFFTLAFYHNIVFHVNRLDFRAEDQLFRDALRRIIKAYRHVRSWRGSDIERYLIDNDDFSVY